MRRLTGLAIGRLLAAGLAVVVGSRLVLWALPVDADWRSAALRTFLVFSPGMLGAAAWWAAGRPGNEAVRRSFQLLGAGLLATFAGGVLVNSDGLLDRPESAPASLPYWLLLMSAVLQAAGVLAWPKRPTPEQGGALFNSVLFAAVGGFVLVKVVVLPLVARGATAGDWMLLGSAISELALFAIVAGGLVAGRWSEPGRLTILAGALIVQAIAAAGFALATGGGVVGTLPDLGWTISTALLTAAIFLRPGWSLDVGVDLPEFAGGLLLGTGLATLTALELADGWTTVASLQRAEEVALAGLFALVVIRYWRVAQERGREALQIRALAAELEAAYATRDAVLEASNTGLRAFGSDGRIVFENSAWLEVVGGEPDRDWRHTPSEHRLRTADGRVLHTSRTTLPTNETLVSVDDLTADERERTTRDRFLAEVVAAQELERRRIAELLHDDAVQRLTALGLRIELASMRSGDRSLLQLSSEAGQILTELRRLLVELHPAVLESQGLSAAIDAASESLRSIGVDVLVEPFTERLRPELEQLAYRLVQEALANSLKHAGATHVQVRLGAADGWLAVEVSDDGRGCDASTAESAVTLGSFGLHLVRERVELAGGQFTLASPPGRGTTFGFELPLSAQPVEAAPVLLAAAS